MTLQSDIQGQLDIQMIGNNMTEDFSLSFSGSFLANEEITVQVDPGNNADVFAGALFSYNTG